MSLKIITLVAAATIGSSSLASASIVTGSFTGTFSGGTDVSGVFTTAGASLSGINFGGTVSYDTDQLSVVPSGTTTTGTSSYAPMSLQFTITTSGGSYTFISNTNASVYVDSGSISEITLTSNNNEQVNNTQFSNSFTLDAYDSMTPFITTPGLEQSFSASPANNSGSLSIYQYDTPSNTTIDNANGNFTISHYNLMTEVSEPISALLLGTGLLCMLGARRVSGRNGTVNLSSME